MPNNFKLRGDYYVSKAGNDSNDGLTPDTPKRTIQAGLNLMTTTGRTLVIGSGEYNETINRTFTFTGTVNIVSDGTVIISGNSLNTFTLGVSSSGTTVTLSSIVFKNYSSISFTSLGVSGTFGGTFNLNSCTIYTKIQTFNLNVHIGLQMAITNCKLISGSMSFETYSSSRLSFNYCIFINYQITNAIINNITNCYFDKTSTVNGLLSNLIFNYNNIQGLIIMPIASTVTSGVIQDTYGRYYDLSIATSTGDGTIGNPYGRPYTNGAGFGFSAHRTAYPTFNASSSAVDPGFNNILKQDFSLQSSSFMVGRASDFINNIGGTYVATRLNASGSTFSGSNATTDNFVFNSGDYVISGSAVTGSVTSAPIFISSSAKVIQEINYNGLLAFNKDTTAPTGSNVNVPDVLTYTSASNQPGANPDRLTYYMRWTTGSSQPVSDAQWENGGLWPAGSFNAFEWNTKPSVDFLGRGNGDQNFNIVNTPTYVKATWIQLRVSLRNDYLI